MTFLTAYFLCGLFFALLVIALLSEFGSVGDLACFVDPELKARRDEMGKSAFDFLYLAILVFMCVVGWPVVIHSIIRSFK
jgi:hypothetical protein